MMIPAEFPAAEIGSGASTDNRDSLILFIDAPLDNTWRPASPQMPATWDEVRRLLAKRWLSELPPAESPIVPQPPQTQ
jgi:hypothetical protein